MPLGIDPWIANGDNYLIFVGLLTSIRNNIMINLSNEIMITLSNERVLEDVNL
jgi:hypothetical protein